jgi:hypothetical protein
MPDLSNQSNQQDMVVMVQVAVSGEVSSPTVIYSMLTSVPPANGAPVVNSNGNIDLTQMAWVNGFTTATDVYFVLTGSLDGAPVFFPNPANQAVSVTIPNTNPPQSAPQFTASLPGDVSVLLINAKNNASGSSNTYNYCLTVQANGSATTFKLDPTIINRFPTTC